MYNSVYRGGRVVTNYDYEGITNAALCMCKVKGVVEVA